MTTGPGERFLPDAATLLAQGGHPPLRPRDAATLLLLRRDGGKTQVLSGRRSEKHKFMPGVYVFPGGGRDPGDSRIAVTGALEQRIAEKLAYRSGPRMTEARMRALAVAAIRETYEEVGLAIGARHTIAESALPFTPHIGPLRLVGRAITPPGRARRFDTRFFALFADEVDIDFSMLRPSPELDALEWVDVDAVGQLKMPGITLSILADISAMLKISPELGLDLPVPFYYMRRGKFVREEI
jgi:8-oxo-dGTP pyrophosphatase MutT (NUDIX family)